MIEGSKVDRLYAWICTDIGGDEGMVAVSRMFNGTPHQAPLISPDRDRIESHRSHAVEMAAITGRPVRLVMFAPGVTLDTVEPPPPAE